MNLSKMPNETLKLEGRSPEGLNVLMHHMALITDSAQLD